MLKVGMFIQNRYEIISKIGSGGMADVYKAKDHKLNRFVAVKVMKRNSGMTNSSSQNSGSRRSLQQALRTPIS